MQLNERSNPMSEEQAASLFEKIKPILQLLHVLEDEDEWTNLYDSDNEYQVIGFTSRPDAHTERQIDCYEAVLDTIPIGYTCHYWCNETHVCQFTIDSSGELMEMIKE